MACRSCTDTHSTSFQPASVPLQVHVQPTTAQQELVRSQLGWKPWSGTLHPGPASRAASCGPVLAGVSLEIQVQVGGLGVSVVGEGEELLYGRISGIQVRAVTGVARQTLELAIQQVQVLPFICPESQFVSNAKSKNCLLSFACPSSTGCPYAAVGGSSTAASVEDMVSADRLPAPLTMPAYLPQRSLSRHGAVPAQVDNPLQNAAYPIMLTSPNTQSSYGVVATAVAAAATAAIPKPAALCLRWSVWRTRPGHVLCVERLEMQTAPLLLEVEQAHAMQLMQFGKSLLTPFADASHAARYVISSKFVSTYSFYMTAAGMYSCCMTATGSL